MIDKNPKEGRYVLFESVLRDGFFGRGGLITAVGTKTVKYDDGKGDGDSSVHVKLCRLITAVCDTPEEMESLLAFSRWAVREHFEMRDRHKAEAAAMMREVGE